MTPTVDGSHHSSDSLARRREEARRRVRRRRTAAAVALLAVAGAVGAVLAIRGGGDDNQQARERAAVSSRRQGAAPAAVRKRRRSGAPAGRRRAREIPAAAAEPRHHRIPILMYHATEAPPPGASSPELWVPADRFAAEMAMLRSGGFHGISLRDAYDYWKGGGARVPRKPIVVSFDDGYRSQYTVAMPALRRLGWPGVLNFEVGALNGRGAEHITRGEVRGLVHAGWEIDAHTINHLDLRTLATDRLRYEVAEGRRQIRRLTGTPVEFFCYPAGKYDAAAIAEVRRAGFLGATTVDPGLASPRELWTLKRVRVNGTDTAETLREKLAAAR